MKPIDYVKPPGICKKCEVVTLKDFQGEGTNISYAPQTWRCSIAPGAVAEEYCTLEDWNICRYS